MIEDDIKKADLLLDKILFNIQFAGVERTKEERIKQVSWLNAINYKITIATSSENIKLIGDLS